MSSEAPEGAAPGPGRRPSRSSSDGGAPVTGALTIVLAIVAVVAGFLILRSINDDDGGTTSGSGDDTEETTSTTPSSTATTLAPSTTSTTQPLVTEGAVVIVANANGIDGSAAGMSTELAGAGYQMGDPTNAAAGEGPIEETVIYYDPEVAAAQAVAESVGRSLGGVAAISPVSTPAPTADGELTGDVLVMLGNDKAGQTLEELVPADGGAATGSSTPVTSPDPAATATTAG